MGSIKEKIEEKIDGHTAKDGSVKKKLQGKPFTMVKKGESTSTVRIEGEEYSCFNSQLIYD